MACNNAYTVYWAGTSFTSAAQIYTDGNLTTVAPDGLYSVGGIVREMTGGILGSPQPCPTCVIPCGQPFNFGGGGTGEYTIYFDLGSSPGAAILTFSPGVNNTTLFPIPDGCTWIYDGVTASEYSSLLGGYQTGIIGAPDPGPPSGFGTPCNITPDLGTNGFQATGVSYLWDQASSNFVAGPTILMGSNVPPTGYTGITNNTQSDLDASGADDLDYTADTKFHFGQIQTSTELKKKSPRGRGALHPHHRRDEQWCTSAAIHTHTRVRLLSPASRHVQPPTHGEIGEIGGAARSQGANRRPGVERVPKRLTLDAHELASGLRGADAWVSSGFLFQQRLRSRAWRMAPGPADSTPCPWAWPG